MKKGCISKRSLSDLKAADGHIELKRNLVAFT